MSDKSDLEVEQLMSEIADHGRDIEQCGMVAARHLRSAAAKLDARDRSAVSGRYVVRLVKGDGCASKQT